MATTAAIAETKIDRDSGTAIAHTRYRSDIDGLRAVAVLSVLAYHVGFAWIPGGYVGVDIFFVISGYLISAIIQNEISSGRFSLTGFYARRICRIVPALVTMALVVSLVACLYLFPFDLEGYARSLVATALSVSNFYFWSVTGYFGMDASTQPLIHTWSLAVEEQFYILLPLFLLVAHRMFPAFRKRGIILVFGASLGLSCYLVFTHPSAAFYLIPTRAWELLVGTILSFPQLSTPIGRRWREALALTGASLIILASFGFSATTLFPGATALVPCVGAALIIRAGQTGRTVVGTMLSMRPCVFIGKISYSLYLWHWPIIVFQHQYALLVPNQSVTLGSHQFLFRNIVIVLVSLVMSILSWRFVEQPFRRGYTTRARSGILIYGAASVALLISFGGTILLEHGFRNRFSPEALRFASYLDYRQEHFRLGQCFIAQPSVAADFDSQHCLEEHSGKRAYLLIGDSMAAQLWYGLSITLNGSDILQATAAGCRPLVEQAFGANPECTKVIDYAFDTFLPTHSVHEVIMSGSWNPGDLPRLARTLALLKEHGIRVLVLGPPIRYTSALPFLLARSVVRNDPQLPDRELLQQSVLDAEVAHVAAAYGASYVSMYGLLCSHGICLKTLPSGEPLEFDDAHFTREGSVVVAQKLAASRALD